MCRVVGLGAVLALLASGCQQVFGLEAPALGDASDAAPGDATRDAVSDGSGSPQSCLQRWHSGPVFSPASVVSEVSSALTAEGDPFLTSDGTTLYFERNNDVYVATRAGKTGAFGAPVLASDLSGSGVETKIFVNATGVRGFLATSRTGGSGLFDLWRASRSTPGGSWSLDQLYLGNVNDANDQLDPFLSPDLLHLYLAPRTGTNQYLAFATRTSVSQNFGAPVPIAELDSPTAIEADPTLTDDELVIVYTTMVASARTLVYSTRTASNKPFAPFAVVPGVAGMSGEDSDPHITNDGCELYFTSTRGGQADIYHASLQ